VRDVPIFLVLGATQEVELSMVESDFVGSDVQLDGSDLPVHCYGNQQAVWLTLPGISSVSEQTRRWSDTTQNGAGHQIDAVRMSLTEKEAYFQRLRYAIKKLRTMRSGIVPANGVLLYVPFDWIVDPECEQFLDTIKTGHVCVAVGTGHQV